MFFIDIVNGDIFLKKFFLDILDVIFLVSVIIFFFEISEYK